MKKKITIIIMLAIVGLSSAFAQGLFGPKTFTTNYAKVVKIALADGVNASQTLEGITIELKPLVDADYEKPIFNPTFNLNFVDVNHKVFADPKVLRVNLDYQLSAFYVTITNNTDHILKMKDARLVFIDPNSDEPIMAYDKQTVKDDIANNFPIYQVLLQKIKNTKGGEYVNCSLSMTDSEISNELMKEVKSVIDQVKFINGFNMEILPGMKTSGYVFFPVKPEKISDGKISFIDMVSKTDAAGNPASKVRFDYKVKSLTYYYKVDPNTNTWAKIEEDEYNKGLTTPEKFWYDKKQKLWISGEPPSKK